MNMKKISIIGSGGAGKSTLAKNLEAILGIKAYHLDALYWQPGWVEPEPAKWRAMQESLCAGSEWILDGNYGGTLDIRLKHSDTLIFLDINKYRCLLRVLWRSLKTYGKTRPDMAQGCKEQFDLHFAKWILDYPNSRKPKILEQLNTLSSEKKVIILSSPKQVRHFLENCRTGI
jgi:adenylate kinase family enzyme